MVKDSDILLLEGIRHRAIFNLIPKYCKKHIAIYIKVSEEKRLDQYITRESPIDINTIEAYKEINSHAVEQEIESLQSLCDLEYDPNYQTMDEIIKILEDKLKVSIR